MFESNADYDFDEDIFAKPFEFEATKVEPTKRAIETDSAKVDRKRPCFDANSSNSSPQTSKTTNADGSGTGARSAFQLKAGPSVCDSASSLKRAAQASVNSPLKTVILRKFPGPAGLLPECRDLKIDIKALEDASTKEAKRESAVDMDVICSQMSVRAFEDGPWERMSRDFRCDLRADFLPDKYNIAWIKSKAKANELINQKAPFLAAIIQNIECRSVKSAIVTMVLKDMSGQIHGTIIVDDLYEKYIKHLTVGSVIILKQFSVFTMYQDTNRYLLTITANNLVSIYSQVRDSNGEANVPESDNCKNVNVITVQKYLTEDFIRNINEVKSRQKLEENSNPEKELENRLLHMRSSEGSAGNVGANFKNNMKFSTPNHRSLSVRSVSNNNIVGEQNVRSPKSTTLTNSANFRSSGGDRGSNSCINIEIKANQCYNKSKFNIKSHLNKLDQNILPPKISDSSGFHTGSVSDFQHLVSVNSNELSNTVTNVSQCSQISVMSNNREHIAILQNIFEGVDADSLFEEF